MPRLEIKPFSINKAWIGKPVKTEGHKKYIKDLRLILPKSFKVPEDVCFAYFEWGFLDKVSDVDNPLKIFLDAVARRYSFDDKVIFQVFLKKEANVEEPYIVFELFNNETDFLRCIQTNIGFGSSNYSAPPNTNNKTRRKVKPAPFFKERKISKNKARKLWGRAYGKNPTKKKTKKKGNKDVT